MSVVYLIVPTTTRIAMLTIPSPLQRRSGRSGDSTVRNGAARVPPSASLSRFSFRIGPHLRPSVFLQVLAQLQATQKERDAAKAQVKELLSQIQQYQEKDIGTT